MLINTMLIVQILGAPAAHNVHPCWDEENCHSVMLMSMGLLCILGTLLSGTEKYVSDVF